MLQAQLHTSRQRVLRALGQFQDSNSMRCWHGTDFDSKLQFWTIIFSARCICGGGLIIWLFFTCCDCQRMRICCAFSTRARFDVMCEI